MTEPGPHQRAYSVMAVPSELEQHRYRKHDSQDNSLTWYQEIYKKYGYEPKLRHPSFFGPYLLLQTLGEGEFAKVKAAVHIHTNQEVAIKLMRKDHIKNASLETKLEREISVLKSVRHPYIVNLFEVLTIKNYIGIVLQRAAGGELFDYILKHHYLQENEAKRLFAQLISGVDYMHRKHIVHRDLKLENLLLSKDRDIIITDFGFANRFAVEKEDLMATSCGSPCYAAPELVVNDDNRYVGTAVDIWSCGVILYAMLCGYLPFDDDPTNPQGANINALYKYIISTPLEIPKTTSPEATHLLRRMLVPDPTKRCTMDEIRQHPWLKEYWDLLDNTPPNLEELSIQERPVSFLQSKFISTLARTNSINSKIPDRSQSVEPSSTRRNRTTSEYYTTKAHHQSLQILPSVSEQTTITNDKTNKTTGQKLMEWFKRKPTTQSTKLQPQSNNNRPERPVSTLPIRAMPIGKSFGSYAADFNDTNLRLHRGAVDQDALTSKAPVQVIQSIQESLSIMGIDMKRVHDFKMKCVRPSKHQKKKPFKLFFHQQQEQKPQDTNVIYGEPSIDPGEEIQFTVELLKIENLPGLYVVDIKRTRGNIWAFKFLYHTCLELLDLGHGYMAHRRVSSSEKQQQQQQNRNSYMTTSSSGSSMMMLE